MRAGVAEELVEAVVVDGPGHGSPVSLGFATA
jgi:hypothetical protein